MSFSGLCALPHKNKQTKGGSSCLCLLSVARINAMSKNDTKGKGFISLSSHNASLKETGQATQEKKCWLAASQAHKSDSFLMWLGPKVQDHSTSNVLRPSHQLEIKQILHRNAHMPNNPWRQFFNWGCLFAGVKLKIKINHHSSLHK